MAVVGRNKRIAVDCNLHKVTCMCTGFAVVGTHNKSHFQGIHIEGKLFVVAQSVVVGLAVAVGRQWRLAVEVCS